MSYHLLHGPNSFDSVETQQAWLKKIKDMPSTPETAYEIARIQGCIERAKARAESDAKANAA